METRGRGSPRCLPQSWWLAGWWRGDERFVPSWPPCPGVTLGHLVALAPGDLLSLSLTCRKRCLRGQCGVGTSSASCREWGAAGPALPAPRRSSPRPLHGRPRGGRPRVPAAVVPAEVVPTSPPRSSLRPLHGRPRVPSMVVPVVVVPVSLQRWSPGPSGRGLA